MNTLIEFFTEFFVRFWTVVGFGIIAWFALLACICGPIYIIKELFVFFFGRERVDNFLKDE